MNYKENIEGDYIVRIYENGTIVKTLISKQTEGEVIELPKNPIIALQEENAQLKANQVLLQNALNELILGGTQ